MKRFGKVRAPYGCLSVALVHFLMSCSGEVSGTSNPATRDNRAIAEAKGEKEPDSRTEAYGPDATLPTDEDKDRDEVAQAANDDEPASSKDPMPADNDDMGAPGPEEAKPGSGKPVVIPKGFVDLGKAAATCKDEKHKRLVPVASASELSAALAGAKAGDLIHLADGTYSGNFVIDKTASAQDPITLCGSSKAILDGKSVKSGYILHLKQVSYWRLIGFTVRNGQKGVMTDGASYNLLDGLTVFEMGDEAVHFRTSSHHNTLQNSVIRDTGHRKPDYAEGVYIGSAKSNLKDDRSDYNMILNNKFGPGIKAEHIDAKEYSGFGLIEGNSFDGTGITGANYSVAVVFIKGVDYIVRANQVKNTNEEGMRVNVVEKGGVSGERNVFESNIIELNGPGYGFNIVNGVGNIVKCNNQVTKAGKGFSNIECTP